MKVLVNEKKVERAKDALRKSNLPITDEAVEALYKTYGGLIIEKEEVEEVEEEKVKPKKKNAK